MFCIFSGQWLYLSVDLPKQYEYYVRWRGMSEARGVQLIDGPRCTMSNYSAAAAAAAVAAGGNSTTFYVIAVSLFTRRSAGRHAEMVKCHEKQHWGLFYCFQWQCDSTGLSSMSAAWTRVAPRSDGEHLASASPVWAVRPPKRRSSRIKAI